jgi:hypothetical protein
MYLPIAIDDFFEIVDSFFFCKMPIIFDVVSQIASLTVLSDNKNHSISVML